MDSVFYALQHMSYITLTANQNRLKLGENMYIYKYYNKQNAIL